MRRFAAVLLAALFLLSLAACSGGRIEELEGRAASLEAENESLALKLREREQELDEAQRELEETRRELEDLKAQQIDYGFTAAEFMSFIDEVALDAEFSSGDASPHYVNKWELPIKYFISGETPPGGRECVMAIAEKFNEIQGFPGMHEVNREADANFVVNFCTYDAIGDLTGDYSGIDGYALFDYYNDTYEIFAAHVYIVNELGERLMRAVLLEEMMHAIGLANDTRRTDSVLTDEYTLIQDFSAIDIAAMNWLYDGRVALKSDYVGCLPVVYEMYYGGELKTEF